MLVQHVKLHRLCEHTYMCIYIYIHMLEIMHVCVCVNVRTHIYTCRTHEVALAWVLAKELNFKLP